MLAESLQPSTCHVSSELIEFLNRYTGMSSRTACLRPRPLVFKAKAKASNQKFKSKPKFKFKSAHVSMFSV